MIYYLLNESSQTQLFSPKWNLPSMIFQDLEWVMDMFNMPDLEDFIVCGGHFRFRVEYNTSDCLVCVYDGKHFYADAAYGNSFIIYDSETYPIRVHNNRQLERVLGQSINPI